MIFVELTNQSMPRVTVVQNPEVTDLTNVDQYPRLSVVDCGIWDCHCQSKEHTSKHMDK